MKKFLKTLIVLFLFTIIPLNIASAEELTKQQKAQYIAKIKELRQIVKQNTADNKKLELKIDDSMEEFGKAIVLLFDRDMPPSEEKLNQIQNKQESMLNYAEQISKIQRSIKRLRTEASINVNEQNYAQAIVKFEKVIPLQQEEAELLKAFDKNLLELIEMIKSLQYK